MIKKNHSIYPSALSYSTTSAISIPASIANDHPAPNPVAPLSPEAISPHAL